jgi:hypothetical protein
MATPAEQPSQPNMKIPDLMPKALRTIPEKNLCHYTSQKGLLGILKSKQLYATDVRFLNDSQEYIYAVDLAKDYLKNHPLRSNDDKRKAFANQALKLLDKDDNLVVTLATPTFVCSFSEKGDLLGQWRAYCPSGNGFAICFSPDLIKGLTNTHGWRLVKCIYSTRDQDEFLEQLERIALTSPIEIPATPGTAPPDWAILSALTFATGLTKYGLALKHPAFEDESEWRAFRYVNPNEKAISIREGKSSLIPYIGFPLTFHDQQTVQIDSLVISPTPNKELSETAAQCLLSGKGASPTKVRHSYIPFRHW